MASRSSFFTCVIPVIAPLLDAPCGAQEGSSEYVHPCDGAATSLPVRHLFGRRHRSGEHRHSERDRQLQQSGVGPNRGRAPV